MALLFKLSAAVLVASGLAIVTANVLGLDLQISYCSKMTQASFCGWQALAFDWQQGWGGAVAAIVAGIAAWATIKATRQAAKDEIAAARTGHALAEIDAARRNLRDHEREATIIQSQLADVELALRTFKDKAVDTNIFQAIQMVSWSRATIGGAPRWIITTGEHGHRKEISEHWNEEFENLLEQANYQAVQKYPTWMRRSDPNFDPTGFNLKLLAQLDEFVAAGDDAYAQAPHASRNVAPRHAINTWAAANRASKKCESYLEGLRAILSEYDAQAQPYEIWFKNHSEKS